MLSVAIPINLLKSDQDLQRTHTARYYLLPINLLKSDQDGIEIAFKYLPPQIRERLKSDQDGIEMIGEMWVEKGVLECVKIRPRWD